MPGLQADVRLAGMMMTTHYFLSVMALNRWLAIHWGIMFVIHMRICRARIYFLLSYIKMLVHLKIVERLASQIL